MSFLEKVVEQIPVPFLRWLLTPPDLEGADERRLGARLHTILVAMLLAMVGLTVYYLGAQVDRLTTSVLLTGGSAVFFFFTLVFLNRGHLQLAGALFMGYLFAATTTVAIGFDGVHDTSIVAYFLLIAVAGLIMGGPAALGAALLSAAALGVIYVIDVSQGGIQPPTLPPHLRVVEIGALLLVMGVVLRLTISDLNWALRRARREVKERKAAEAALARSRDELEERVAARTMELARANHELQTLIESSQNGILFVTDDLHLSVINSRALELLGLSGTPDDWQGNVAGALFDKVEENASSTAGSVRVELTRLWAGSVDSDEAPVEGEFQIDDRSLYWYIVPVTVGERVADLIVLRDVTSDRQLEQMRHELVHTLVHDLRNPLSGMLSMLSLLTLLDRQQQEELAPRQQRYVNRLTESVEYMTRLVNNILDVSRLESGQMPLQRTRVEIKELVTETVEAQRTLAAEKEVSLSSRVAPDLPAAWVDKAVVERVLKNLLDNAIKFTSSGGNVRVAAAPTAEGNGNPAMVKVAVHDTGPGISPELRPNLFQKFASGEQAGAGSGLGLAFCKLAVEAHGGQLWLQDRSQNAETGSSFVFTVPAAVKGST